MNNEPTRAGLGDSPSAEGDAPLTVDGHWDFHYTYFAGRAATQFFSELRDNRRIMGTHCPACNRVLVPARGFCDACFVTTGEWREVGEEGYLDTFTILTASFPGLPEPPAVVGYVTLDGASSAMLNMVEGVDLSDIDAAGEFLLTRPKVHVRFSEKPQGRISDFVFEVQS